MNQARPTLIGPNSVVRMVSQETLAQQRAKAHTFWIKAQNIKE